jgi:adenine-specific DNA-methyltransferase
MAQKKFDDLSKEELVRLLESRDRRDATRFGLIWEANEIERDKAVNNDLVVLDIDKSLSIGDGPWQNLIIEGDNFDALRYLRMTFAGRVKCIFIDPPYNTGKKDFVYNDCFVAKEDLWRFSTWLEFLYQRLVIARDLLREDGVLLCCINDENRAKLELLLDKVFPGRRIGSFVWRTKDSANDAGGNLSQVHEHVLVYANPMFAFAGKPIDVSDYRNPDNDARGLWTPQRLTCAKTLKERENLYYPIQDPETNYWYPCDPERVWAYATETKLRSGTKLRTETIEELIRKKEIYFPACKPSEIMRFETREALVKALRDGKGPVLPKKQTALLREDLPDLDFWVGQPIAPGRPSRKDFLNRKDKLVAALSSWIAGQNEDVDYLYDELDEQLDLMRSPRGGEGTDAINAILGSKAFNHPKPPTLIRNLVRQSAGPNDLVVDFFAGSGTTAQAVLELNKADGDPGRRRFILVSSTEVTEDEPNKNICRDVCKKRVENVIRGYQNTPGTGGDFAYLTCRRIDPGKLMEIDHAQVWTALQLTHCETLSAYREEAVLHAGVDDQLLIYLPRFKRGDMEALLKAVKETRAVIVYSWQPELVRQRLRNETHVQVEAVPESLARRFGMKV